MNTYVYINLRQRPELKEKAAKWFHEKWKIPMQAYEQCIQDYLNQDTPYGWYVCLYEDEMIGGLGVIENDFHDRKDLAPNICAVYTEKEYRNQGIAGKLLDLAIKDLKVSGIAPIYLVTDHIGFYERYGWKFLCMVQTDGENKMSRMYTYQ